MLRIQKAHQQTPKFVTNKSTTTLKNYANAQLKLFENLNSKQRQRRSPKPKVKFEVEDKPKQISSSDSAVNLKTRIIIVKEYQFQGTISTKRILISSCNLPHKCLLLLTITNSTRQQKNIVPTTTTPTKINKTKRVGAKSTLILLRNVFSFNILIAKNKATNVKSATTAAKIRKEATAVTVTEELTTGLTLVLIFALLSVLVTALSQFTEVETANSSCLQYKQQKSRFNIDIENNYQNFYNKINNNTLIYLKICKFKLTSTNEKCEKLYKNKTETASVERININARQIAIACILRNVVKKYVRATEKQQH